ncbi:WhiB family transcriptional regulator [Amycolatopsis sp. NPDC004368]
MDWRQRAACAEEEPELFFPVGNGDAARRQESEAKAVCHRCPVREACLAWAMATGQDAGIWGGLNELERRVLKRRSAAAARAA